MSKKLTWQEWWSNWSKQAVTRDALNRFYNIPGNDKDSHITLQRIVIACYKAAHYDPAKDPGLLYREKIKIEKDQRTKLADAAHVLARSAKRGDRSLLWAMDFAEERSGVRITRKDYTEKMALNVVAHEYFSHLEKALIGKLPELDGGPWLRRFTVGNLTFDVPLGKAGHPIETVSMLAFELAFYLRMYTAGRASDGWQNGQRMHTDGKPRNDVVAAFCNATLDTKVDADNIKQRLKGMSKIKAGITDWTGVVIPNK